MGRPRQWSRHTRREIAKEPACARRTDSFEAGADGGVRASRGGVTYVTVINPWPDVSGFAKFMPEVLNASNGRYVIRPLQVPRGTRSRDRRSGTVTPVTATSPPPGAGFDHDLPEPAEVALRLGRAVETTYAATDVPLAPAFTGGAFQ